MSLIQKLFGRKAGAAPPAAPESDRFQDSDSTTTEQASRNAPRRELVLVVLRDTVRRHGIPQGWVECHILSTVTRKGTSGLHVQLVLRDAQDRLLQFVPAFQASFLAEIEKFDPKAREWLLSISWQFKKKGEPAAMPEPVVWAGAADVAAAAVVALPVAASAAAAQEQPEEEDVMRDVEALFAIRDAALRGDPAQDHVDFQPTEPGGVPQERAETPRRAAGRG